MMQKHYRLFAFLLGALMALGLNVYLGKTASAPSQCNLAYYETLPQDDWVATAELSTSQKHSLGSLDEALKDPSSVYQLDLIYKGISSLSPEVGRLRNLRTLRMYNSEGDPFCLFNCTGGKNTFTTLPCEVGALTHLEYLDLGYVEIERLPDEIGKLVRLEKLVLNGHRLQALPQQFGRLTALKHLDLSGQSFPLPEELTKLTSLEYVGIRGFDYFPEVVVTLPHLKKLDLAYTDLTSLPASIQKLSQLEELYIYDGSLTSLPKEIGSLTTLKKINLYGNSLTSLPSELSNLQNLEELNLDDNPLTASEVDKLKQALPKTKIYFNEK